MFSISSARHVAAKSSSHAIAKGLTSSTFSQSLVAKFSSIRSALVSASSSSASSMRPLSEFRPTTPSARAFAKLAQGHDMTSSAPAKLQKDASGEVSSPSARVIEAVRLQSAKYTHDKPAVAVPFTLRNGTEGVARRVGLQDIEALYEFQSTAMMLGHGLATETNSVNAMTDVLLAASAANSDALVAVTADGKIIGLTTYDSSAPVYEPQLDQDDVTSLGMPTPAAVTWTKVHQHYVGQGVGAALMKVKLLSAYDAGYGSVAGYGSNPAVQAIAEKLGGKSQPGSLGWTVVPCEIYVASTR